MLCKHCAICLEPRNWFPVQLCTLCVDSKFQGIYWDFCKWSIGGCYVWSCCSGALLLSTNTDSRNPKLFDPCCTSCKYNKAACWISAWLTAVQYVHLLAACVLCCMALLPDLFLIKDGLCTLLLLLFPSGINCPTDLNGAISSRFSNNH